MNIAFIGMGRFGRAIASLVEHNGLKYDYAEASEKRLLSRPADIVFLTVPTQFLRQALKANSQWLRASTIIVNCAKGIEAETNCLVYQIVKETGSYPLYYSLLGPSFDYGIRENHPTVVSLGYQNPKDIKTIKKVLQTAYFRIEETPGFQALELSSALKNVYAIACGYARGLGFGSNTRAELITVALKEFSLLANAMKFTKYDVTAPGIVGDLVLTCSSEHSRNFMFGLKLAESHDRQFDSTVEGYHTAKSIRQLARQYKIKLPLANLTHDIINGKSISKQAFRDFLASY